MRRWRRGAGPRTEFHSVACGRLSADNCKGIRFPNQLLVRLSFEISAYRRYVVRFGYGQRECGANQRRHFADAELFLDSGHCLFCSWLTHTGGRRHAHELTIGSLNVRTFNLDLDNLIASCEKRVEDARVKLPSTAFVHNGETFFQGKRGSVGAVGAQCVEDIRDRRDTAFQRYILADQAERITRAVPTFVVRLRNLHCHR